MKKSYSFNINGFITEAVYEADCVENIFLPLLHKWSALYRQKQRRILVFLSAPPGTGKTTVCRFLEHLSHLQADTEPLQAIGLDGFHHTAAYIACHTVTVNGAEVPMQSVKGSPETFDLIKLTEKLTALKSGDVLWPVYDRNLHDVVEDAVSVTTNIVLLEGNWLLSAEPRWQELIDLCDDSVFIAAKKEDLRERLVCRKMAGGLSREEAERFFVNSDGKNVDRLMGCRHPAGTELVMDTDGNYRKP